MLFFFNNAIIIHNLELHKIPLDILTYIINPVISRTVYIGHIGHGSRLAHNGIALQFSSCIH